MTLSVVAAALVALAVIGLLFVAAQQDRLLRQSFKAMRKAGNAIDLLADANARLCHRAAVEVAIATTWRQAAIAALTEIDPGILERLKQAEAEFRAQREAAFIASRPAAKPEQASA